MTRLKHPLSGTPYERLDDGTVRVGREGSEGIFDREGNWLRGERRTADPALCQWVSDNYRPKPGRVLLDYKQVLLEENLGY